MLLFSGARLIVFVAKRPSVMTLHPDPNPEAPQAQPPVVESSAPIDYDSNPPPATCLESCHLWVGTPVDGGISGNYVSSMVKLALHMARAKIPMSYHQIHNDSLITRARNTMVGQFLKDPTATHMLFLDSDVGFEPEVVIKLLASGYDVCGAPYPMKSVNMDRARKHVEREHAKTGEIPSVKDMETAATKYILNLITEDAMEEVKNPDGSVTRRSKQSSKRIRDGFVEVSEIGTGFLMIKKTALMRMMRHYPEAYYITDIPDLKEADKQAQAANLRHFWTFFDTMVHPVSRRYLSEDYAFCQRYRDTGGKIYLYLDATISHTGPYTFIGNLFQTLKIEGSVEASVQKVPSAQGDANSASEAQKSESEPPAGA